MSMNNEENAQLSRVEALDSLRGWAILGVIAIHVSHEVLLPQGILHSIASNGDMGVELFYVLSAFSLTMSLKARAIAGYHGLVGYFIRRFFRIAPMFWAVLLVASVVLFGKSTFWSPVGIGWKEIGLTAVFLHGIYPDTINAVIPGGWSVAVEVMFYLILPVLFSYVKTTKAALGWLLIFTVVYFLFGIAAQTYFTQSLQPNAQHLATIYSWYMSFPAQMPVFMMGIVAFFVVKNRYLEADHAYIITVLAGLALFSMTSASENHTLPRHLLWGGVFSIFLVANVQRPLAIFDNAIMRKLGRISFSIYLLHFFVLKIVSKLFDNIALGPEIKFALLYLVATGITYLLAAWSYRAIELPGMKFGGELSRRFESNSPNLKKEENE